MGQLLMEYQFLIAGSQAVFFGIFIPFTVIVVVGSRTEGVTCKVKVPRKKNIGMRLNHRVTRPVGWACSLCTNSVQ